MPDQVQAGRGWFSPLGSQKAHYMIAGRSLCGRWGYLGRPEGLRATVADRFCCAKCRAKVAHLKAKEAEAAHAPD